MIKLYSYFRSSSSYRVRIALNLKGLDYEIVPVHLLNDGGEQFKPHFRQLNPSARIPVLEDGHFRISQSSVILEYLDESFPSLPLLPGDIQEKSQIRELCQIINSDIQPLQNLSVLKKLVKDYGFSDEQKSEWIRYWIRLGFESIEKRLINTVGQFSFGDRPTAADCYLVPQVYNAIRHGVNLDLFPKIKEVTDNCLELEAVQMAHPDNQPDAPTNSP